MSRNILRSTPATLQLEVYSSGNLTDLDADPILIVTDGNGATVVSGTPTKPPSPDNVGVYRSLLPPQADLSVLTAVWTGDLSGQSVTFTQSYEIVGNLLFTEAEARAEPIVGQQAALADTSKYDDARIAHWRAVIGDIFESRMNRGVVRRYCRARFNGVSGSLDLTYGYPVLANGSFLERPGRMWDISRVISATIDGTAQDVADLEIVRSKLHHTTGSWSAGDIFIEYEYGPDPVEAEAHQRALDLLLANAAPSGHPSTATSINTEDGSYRITNFPVAVEEFLARGKHRKGFGFA